MIRTITAAVATALVAGGLMLAAAPAQADECPFGQTCSPVPPSPPCVPTFGAPCPMFGYPYAATTQGTVKAHVQSRFHHQPARHGIR